MDFNTIFVFPGDTRIAANDRFYSMVEDNIEVLENLYKQFGIYMFDLVNFERYLEPGVFTFMDFFDQIKLTENRQFLNELCRILHRSSKPPTDVINYVVNNTPADIIPAYYRMFSQVSLLVDSNFNKNLMTSTNAIVNGITCDIINNLNDIELCCFFVRYCDTKELLAQAKSRLCEETLADIDSRLSSGRLSTKIVQCSCKKSSQDVTDPKC